MLERLSLTRYKGFESFSVSFGDKNILVGPNNAGKTTLISALRLCAAATSHARRRKPDEAHQDDDRYVVGYRLSALAQREAAGFVAENVRHELRDDETTRLALTFKAGSGLTIVWPSGDEEPFFYLDKLPGMNVRTAAVARQSVGEIGLVPTLVPVEHREPMVTEEHVRKNLLSRLTSRLFRNQLYYMRANRPEEFGAFVEFALSNTPELVALNLATATGDRGTELDLFYEEVGSRTPKEIYWAGDGVQIWLQVLYHCFRQATTETLVLDEPDVFLHPNLQRRLIGILEDREQQIVLATHAPEMLTEAARESVVWIDRTRKNSRRIRDQSVLSAVNMKLGSGFNLEMARALRSRVALFVEGDDMKLLRNIARTVGARRVASERGVSVIPLRGFSNWQHIEPFAWMTRDLLGQAVKIWVVLDRDYRTDEQAYDVTEQLRRAGVRAHIWRRKELESYLLVPSTVARLTSTEEELVTQILLDAAESMRAETFANFAHERAKTKGSRHDVSIVAESLPVFEQAWSSPEAKLNMAPPKDLLNALNGKLVTLGKSATSFRALSHRLREGEVPDEMRSLLLDLEDLL